MYTFILFGHLVSKAIDHSFIFTYLCWYGSFGIDFEFATQTLSIAMIITIIYMPILGNLSDHVGYEYLLVLVYGLRLTSMVSFFFLRVPNDFVAMGTVVVLMCSSYAEQLVIYSLFTKRIPGDLRGAMRGIFYSLGCLGQLLVSQISIYVVDANYSLSSPFCAIASLDAFMVFVSLMIGLLGIFDEDKYVGKKSKSPTHA